jgi:ribose transport system ATP-binding protein
MDSKEIAVKMTGVSKHFNGICALDKIDLEIKKGTIHAILGENGAGKSTLMKILCGLVSMDTGKIELFGKEIKFKSIIEALENKIAIVPQELALVDYFTVAENIYLGKEKIKNGFIDMDVMNHDAEVLLSEIKINLNPKSIVSDLSVSQKQMLVIARVLSEDAEVIIMDEPTARLGVQEIKDFLEYMKYLREIGKTIIFITHKLNEVFEISDEVTVLRDGKLISTHRIEEVTEDKIIREMVNRSSESLGIEKRHKELKEIVLEVKNISSEQMVQDVSFELHKGEILGFYGLVGSGRTEMIRAILGIDSKKGGSVKYKDEFVEFKNIRESMESGLVLIPEERRQQGLVMNLPIQQNSSLTKLKYFSKYGFVNQKKERSSVAKLKNELRINCSSINDPVGSLSGGNQQKVVLSKFLDMPVDIYIFDEPTRGIDVGAKKEIYKLIQEISESNASIIIISSEIPEIQSICDRIIVMNEGKAVKSLGPEEFMDAEVIMKYSIGGKHGKTAKN